MSIKAGEQELRSVVFTALAKGRITPEDKQLILDVIARHGLPKAAATRIIQEVGKARKEHREHEAAAEAELTASVSDSLPDEPATLSATDLPAMRQAATAQDMNLLMEGSGMSLTRPCPACARTCDVNDMLCIGCGYNFALKKQMQTAMSEHSGLIPPRPAEKAPRQPDALKKYLAIAACAAVIVGAGAFLWVNLFGAGTAATPADPVAVAAANSELGKKLISQTKSDEARTWLEAKADNTIRRLPHDDALARVKGLYAAGATKVLITGVNSGPSGAVASTVVVELPADAAARAQIFSLHADLLKIMADEDRPADAGQTYLLAKGD